MQVIRGSGVRDTTLEHGISHYGRPNADNPDMDIAPAQHVRMHTGCISRCISNLSATNVIGGLAKSGFGWGYIWDDRSFRGLVSNIETGSQDCRTIYKLLPRVHSGEIHHPTISMMIKVHLNCV